MNFLLIASALTEVIKEKKNFEDKVSDFYNKFKEQKDNSRKLVNDELTQFFEIMTQSPNTYVPFDKNGIKKDFNNFSYNFKNKNH